MYFFLIEKCVYQQNDWSNLLYLGTSSCVSFDAMPQASLEEMVEGTGTVLPSYDETALCSAAFKILRSMVNVWLRDVSIHQNAYADFQIIHFYRWIRSTNALLYDPALQRTLYNLMKKLFMQVSLVEDRDVEIFCSMFNFFFQWIFSSSLNLNALDRLLYSLISTELSFALRRNH